MQKVYGKCMIKRDLQKNRPKKLPQKLRQSYDKMYDSLLAVVRWHQAGMQ